MIFSLSCVCNGNAQIYRRLSKDQFEECSPARQREVRPTDQMLKPRICVIRVNSLHRQKKIYVILPTSTHWENDRFTQSLSLFQTDQYDHLDQSG